MAGFLLQTKPSEGLACHMDSDTKNQCCKECTAASSREHPTHRHIGTLRPSTIPRMALPQHGHLFCGMSRLRRRRSLRAKPSAPTLRASIPIKAANAHGAQTAFVPP